MKVYLDDYTPHPTKFGGSTSMTAELDDEVTTELNMEDALCKFAKQLINQFGNLKFQSNRRVVGVELHSINFSLITDD